MIKDEETNNDQLDFIGNFSIERIGLSTPYPFQRLDRAPYIFTPTTHSIQSPRCLLPRVLPTSSLL